MKQNVIITGSGGLLGKYLCSHFSKTHKVIAVYHTAPSQADNVTAVRTDLSQASKLADFIDQYPADFVIHTAGLTSVDACEENPSLAQKLNVEMTDALLARLKPERTRFIHLSTDHLFSGEHSFYTETSDVQPLNAYARTKYEAERHVCDFANSVSLRTNFYGGESWQKKSFSNWIYRELKNGNKLRLFDDVFFTPISVCALAANIELIMHSKLKGIYNIASTERISKYHFALKLAKVFGLNPELIIHAKIDQAMLKARRPHDMSLSIAKLQKDLPAYVHEDILTGLEKIKTQNLV